MASASSISPIARLLIALVVLNIVILFNVKVGTPHTVLFRAGYNFKPSDKEPPDETCEKAKRSTRYCILKALINGDQKVRQHLIEESRRPFYISTCTALKYAGDHVHEFIVRNYLAGVDHFFLYDDDTERTLDNERDENEKLPILLEQLAPLVTITRPPDKESFLKLIGREGQPTSALGHRHHMTNWHCFLTYGNRSRWILPIDGDEFLEAKQPHLLETESTRFRDVPFMQVYLKRIENSHPAQIGRWNTVLTNGKIYPPQDGRSLAQKYPIACGYKDIFLKHNYAGVLFSAKSAIQPRYLDMDFYAGQGLFFVHGVRHWGTGDPQELFFKGPFRGYNISVNTDETEWLIVHYWSRSYADFTIKSKRGRLSGMSPRSLAELVAREFRCKTEQNVGISESARLRQEHVSDLLADIVTFKSIQQKYYRLVASDLDEKDLKTYKNAMKFLEIKSIEEVQDFLQKHLPKT